MNKILSLKDTAMLIKDNDTVCIVAGGGGINEPYAILQALENRYKTELHPSGLTLYHSAGIGDKNGGGIDRFAHAGMVKTVIGSHWTWSVNMQKMALNNEIEAYTLPQGVMSQLMREIAAKRPGLITKTGLHTFIDPRIEGGAMNSISTHKFNEVISINNEEWLFYKSIPINVTIIRATTADTKGNLTCEHEGILTEILPAAQAAKNSGGIVLAQVDRVVEAGTLNPMHVKVPGILVDAIVEVPNQRMSAKTIYDPALSGECRRCLDKTLYMELNNRKIIARRVAMEIKRNMVVNLGFGIPAGVGSVLREEGIANQISISVEQGITGGVPAGGSDFGLVYNSDAIIDTTNQFDFYDGGGIDIAVLSFAEFDQYGNVNVSRFGKILNGVGGFINISQATKKMIFAGTFTTKGLKQICTDGMLKILQEGSTKKAVNTVQQISYSGKYACQTGQKVMYITERAVFELSHGKIKLIEIAPNIDLKKDILNLMEFQPEISENLKEMNPAIFRDTPMKLILD